ncbi:hypothetical protein BGZ82_001521 [Podila clonocystis]|nr:hypothetical protein BGZ82_001521 [Podila clonocystis]
MTRPIPESTVEEVKHLKEESLTNQAAADVAGISPTSVGRIAHKEGLPVGPAGRPKKLSDGTVEELVREHQTGEFQTYVEATDCVNEMLNESVSYSTVRRAMHDVEDAQEGEMAQPHQGTGGLPRHKKMPDESVEELVRERAAREISSSYKEAHLRANEILEDPVSYSTIRRRLHEAEDQ